jgi:type II secretory pathway pseudopilin PulG
LELAIVLGVIGLVVAVSLTNYRAITRDRKFAQAEKDLQVLKGAVFSYWKQNSLRYPKDVNRSLASSRPHGADETLKDPWRTDPKTSGYGFLKGMHPNIGEYFILYTQGPERDTLPKLNVASQSVEYSGSGIVVSNLPTKKISLNAK